MKKSLLFYVFLISLPLPALAGPCESQVFGSATGIKVETYRAGVTQHRPSFVTPQWVGEGPGRSSADQAVFVSGQPAHRPVEVGIFESALHWSAKTLLGREINPRERQAIEQANQTGRAYDPTNNKTSWVQIRKKANILKSAGFSAEETRSLMEEGLVWIRNFDRHDLLIRILQKGGRKEGVPFITADWKKGRITKVLKETEEGFEVEAEIIKPHIGRKILEPEIPIHTSNLFIPKVKKYFFNSPKYTHPDILSVFESIKHSGQKINQTGFEKGGTLEALPSYSQDMKHENSNKISISRENLEVTSSIQNESHLKAQGYGPFFVKGIDDIPEWVALRRQWQELRANPYKTHIPYFADKIEEHIAFVVKGLGPHINPQQQKALSKLKREAKKAVEQEKVTYYWWIEFNYQLSHVLSNKTWVANRTNPYGRDMEFIWDIISYFPIRVMIPTTKEELGIISLSRAYNEGIYPISLTSQTKKVNDVPMDPIAFLEHDISHAYNFLLSKDITQYSPGHKLRYNKIQALISTLPYEQRKLAEVVYFISIHEESIDLLVDKPREEIRQTLSQDVARSLQNKAFPKEIIGIKPPEYDTLNRFAKIKHIKEHIVDVFMKRVYDEAF